MTNYSNSASPNQVSYKQQAAHAALKYVEPDTIVGVGSGSTVNYFIEALALLKGKIEGAVAASEASAQLLKQYHIPVFDLNSVDELPVYIDGADEVNPYLQMIKGGGGAATREKIIANVAQRFICIADQSKWVERLGAFPIAVEVLPLARSYVARQIVKLGGDPIYRENFVTDNGNIILDIHNLLITQPIELEHQLNNISGVVGNGIFAQRNADILLIGGENGLEERRART